jgi:DNA-binding transcriptional MerR regulator
MAFTVGQLAKLTGLTVRALHHYDAIGLLVPSQRTEAGYRLYAQSDIVKLFRVQALQDLGLSLSEIEGLLDRASTALPELVTRQITVLDSQIERATTLRQRLTQLSQLLARGVEPATDDWLDAVELITLHDRRCSPEELALLLDNKNDAASWNSLVNDVRAAMDDGIPPKTARAGALIDRWSELMLRSVGGDLHLAIKMKLAYADDPSMQARMSAQSGLDEQVMLYLAQAAQHKQLGLWRRHMPADDVARLQPDLDWNHQLLRTVAALREAHGKPDAARSGAPTDAVRAWTALIRYFAASDPRLEREVAKALATDRDLQRCWLLEPSLIDFIARPQRERER